MNTYTNDNAMTTNRTIHYSDGSVVHNAVICIWEDHHTERSGYKRAFWCASPDANSGSPVIGYCSSGGSYRAVSSVAREARRLYPEVPIYRNGRLTNHEPTKGKRL